MLLVSDCTCVCIFHIFFFCIQRIAFLLAKPLSDYPGVFFASAVTQIDVIQ